MASALTKRSIPALATGMLLLTGCAGYVAPPVDPQWKSHSRSPIPVLQRGYEVHQAKCAKCHPFENPADYGEAEWRDDIMPVMARKSKLDEADARAVLEYVLAARKIPPPTSP